MRLSQYRIEKDLTFGELSRLLGISKTRVFRICNGNRECLRVSELPQIVNATGGEVTLADLLDEVESC